MLLTTLRSKNQKKSRKASGSDNTITYVFNGLTMCFDNTTEPTILDQRGNDTATIEENIKALQRGNANKCARKTIIEEKTESMERLNVITHAIATIVKGVTTDKTKKTKYGNIDSSLPLIEEGNEAKNNDDDEKTSIQ